MSRVIPAFRGIIPPLMENRSNISLDYSYTGHPAKKYVCPSCKKKRFVRYINLSTNVLYGEQYGRCDREDSCGYFMHPSEGGELTKDDYRARERETDYQVRAIENDFKTVDRQLMVRTMAGYENNVLFQWFAAKFGYQFTENLFWLFYAGTANDGSTIFWQVDEHLNPRTANKVAYVGFNRDKNKLPYRLFKTEDNYKSCLFGLHQLNGLFNEKEDYRICIVESEKTAMLCRGFMPTLFFKDVEKKIIWLASCACDGLTKEKVAPLKGWKVVLWPDYSWLSRAKWGLTPMRRKLHNDPDFINPKTLQRGRESLRIDETGEIDNTYDSAVDRIENAGADYCGVFDFMPGLTDGSDIADILKDWEYVDENEQPLVNYKKPNFEAYKITTTEYHGDNMVTILTEEFVPINPDIYRQKFLVNPEVKSLMNKFNLYVSDIQSL